MRPKRERVKGARKDTYQVSQYVNFVKEHFLLVLVHVCLSQHLDSSLSTGISMNAHSHLTESTYIDMRAISK